LGLRGDQHTAGVPDDDGRPHFRFVRDYVDRNRVMRDGNLTVPVHASSSPVLVRNLA
jgi:hypothetical protein